MNSYANQKNGVVLISNTALNKTLAFNYEIISGMAEAGGSENGSIYDLNFVVDMFIF